MSKQYYGIGLWIVFYVFIHLNCFAAQGTHKKFSSPLGAKIIPLAPYPLDICMSRGKSWIVNSVRRSGMILRAGTHVLLQGLHSRVPKEARAVAEHKLLRPGGPSL